jgi:hypothetical protein
MKRRLHFAILIFAFALYGIGVNIISGIASPTAAPELVSEASPCHQSRLPQLHLRSHLQLQRRLSRTPRQESR